MRVKETIDEMRYKRGIAVERLGFLVRDGTGEKLVTVFRYDKSYLYTTDTDTEDEAQIPYHRVIAIFHRGQAIWAKRELAS